MRLPSLEHDYPLALLQQAAAIQLLVTDVDGVLTPGFITWDANGVETKQFSVKDGYGLKAVRRVGVKTAIITARVSDIVQRRGEELAVDYIFQGVSHKGQCLEALMAREELPPEQVAYMGDDVPDLDALQVAGLRACPADAAWPVRQLCTWISRQGGGQGAMRELCDLVVAAKQASEAGLLP